MGKIKKAVARCKLALGIEEFTDDPDFETLDKWLNTPVKEGGKSAEWLVPRLAKLGIDVRDTTIKVHRRQACACYR